MASADLLPPNATPLCRALATLGQRLTDLPLPIRSTWSPADCPAQVLPWLAWAFGVEDWDTSWTEDQQRAAVAASLAVHRIKGTVGAVNRAVGALGLQCQVVEWFSQQPMGAPYTYSLVLTVTQQGYTLEQLNRLLSVINRAKSLRSHLDHLQINVVSQCTAYAAATTLTGFELTVKYSGAMPVPLTYDGSWTFDGSKTYSGFTLQETAP